jgi:SpoVK/Ycf46/Vps4 family AAA+-type ATPase
MRFEQDPRFTFDTFVDGPGSQMAAAAARRAAESPGTSYNPLFLYGEPGVGKTHLLHAVGALARAVRPELRVYFRAAEELVDDLSSAVAAGTVESFRDELLESDLVLLDDVHALAGKGRTQEELLSAWDELVWSGIQVVLAARVPPAEIPALNEDLRGRLAGGLVVDITPPEAETRLGIISRGARDRGLALGEGVGDALARLPLDGGHALHAGLDRIARVQADESRQVSAGEVAGLVGAAEEGAGPADEFSAFLADIAFTVEQIVETDPWRKRLAESLLRYEGEGVRTRRLETALEADRAPDVDGLLRAFTADVERLRAIQAELRAIDEKAAASSVLSDPDRLAEAEALLASAQAAAERRAEAVPAPAVDRWYHNNAEKVAWSWLALEDRVIEELG